MKVSMIAERADIATGTFYHFFDSKEAYVKALLEAQDRKMQAELLPMLQKTGKLTIEQAIRWFRDSFRTENNILMESTLDDRGGSNPIGQRMDFSVQRTMSRRQSVILPV